MPCFQIRIGFQKRKTMLWDEENAYKESNFPELLQYLLNLCCCACPQFDFGLCEDRDWDAA
jgi:hypothetical protein